MLDDNLNPIFEQQMKKEKERSSSKITSKKTRKERSDKRHDIKFPVTPEQRIHFNQSWKRFKFHYPQIAKKFGQTKYHTLLVQVALDKPEIINWNIHYQDRHKKYLHVKLSKEHYNAVGGIYGLSTINNLSDRKTVFMLAFSALNYIEKGGKYDEVLQQFEPSK